MILNWLIPILWIGGLYAQTNLEKGLIAYNRKAEGSIEDRAQPAAINEAIKYYQLALDEPDAEIDAAIGLLKSYYFKGKYVSSTKDEQKAVFDKAKNLALTYIDRYPEKPGFHYWYLTNLGSWAEVYGILTAAREGVADQMKDHAMKIIALDPKYEDGGGYLMLGAVHYKSPYIPFILSWPDNEEAVKWLQKAFITGEATPIQKVYLAQALYKEKQKNKAIAILQEVINMTPSFVESVSDWEQIKKARVLLQKYQ